MDDARDRDRRRARVLLIAGSFARHSGAFEDAERYGQEGVAIFKECGDEAEVAWGLQGLGVLALERADFAGAGSIIDEAADFARAAGAAGLIANLTGIRADLALRQRDYVSARELAEQTLALYRDMNRNAGIGWTLYLLGVSWAGAGRIEDAVDAATEGLEITRSTGDTETAVWLFILIATLGSSRSAESAAMLVGAADALCEPLGLVLTGVEADLKRRIDDDLTRKLSTTGYEAARARGQALSLDDAIELAFTTLKYDQRHARDKSVD